MFLSCCLIPKIVIMLRHILYLVSLCLKQADLFFVHFLEYSLLDLDDNVDEVRKQFSNSKSPASGCYLAFA